MRYSLATMQMLTVPLALSLAAGLLLAGCASSKNRTEGPSLPPPMQPSRAVAAQVRAHMDNAEKLYRRGFYDEALAEVAQAMRLDPRSERLRALFYEIQANQLSQRAKQVAEEATLSHRKAALEVESNRLVPLSYGSRRPIAPGPDDTQTPPTPMELALKKPVSVRFESASLSAVLLRLGEEHKINIIADPAALQGRTVTLHVENAPLKEIFDYLTRNLAVAFYVGENVIWMTQQSAPESPVPLETRIYHLREGVHFEEAGIAGAGAPGGAAGGGLGGLLGGAVGGPQAGNTGGAAAGAYGGQAGGLLRQLQQQLGMAAGPTTALTAGGPTTLEQVIAMFVPQPPGSQFWFDRPSHTLISKNTRENNALIEKIIKALDVASKQILIEARFLEISADDLKELGIDFALNSPYAITKEGGQPKTQIDMGNILNYGQFPNVTEGLNLAYSGILTDPMFKAVLHALETSKKAHSISNPRVTTLNNRPATIRVGEDFRYFDNYSIQVVQSGVTTGGIPLYATQVVPTGTPTVEPLGVALTVTPSVGANSDNITLVLEPTIRQFLRYETFQTFSTSQQQQNNQPPASGEIRLPVFSNSSVTSKAIVRSGETVVLGGLIKASESKERREPPIVGKIPVLGKLFRHNIDETKRSNLLIFVTATLISSVGHSQIPTTPLDQ